MSTDAATDDKTMPFLEHLEELRGTIVRSLLAWGIGMVVIVPAMKYVKAFFMYPWVKAGMDPEHLIIIEMMGPLKVAISFVMWGGLIIAAPFIIFFIMQFVFPGLLEREKKAIKMSSFFAVTLFFTGVALCYFITIPYAVKLLYWLKIWLVGQDVGQETLMVQYVGFCLKVMLAFGLCFQLPIITFILGYLGVVSSDTMKEKRRHIFVFLLILAMFLTPPDIISQIILAVPLYGMFEICIHLIAIKERRDAAAGI